MDEKLSPIEFLEKYHDGVYELHYQTVKDSAFDFYRWGLRTENVEAVNFCRELLNLYRKYDDKFIRDNGEE